MVIGVSKDLADEVSPYEIYPPLVKERTLRQVIGDLPSLKIMGEISEDDIFPLIPGIHVHFCFFF